MIGRRQIVALICGAGSAYLFVARGRSSSDLIFACAAAATSPAGAVAIGLAGVTAGAITALVSWRHTPGLPGMGFALGMAAAGRRAPASEESLAFEIPEAAWISYTIEGLLMLTGLLATYSAAWAADTYVVFRNLTAKPPPKQITGRLMLTRLLPGCLATAAGGTLLGFLLPLPLLLAIPLAFAATSRATSALFLVRSTLWYAVSAPLGLVLLGAFVLARPEAAGFILSRTRELPGFLSVCGLGSAGAILGHWWWVRQITD